MPSVWTFVSDRISSTLTLKYLGLRKFCRKINILSSIPTSFIPIRMPYLHVKSCGSSISKKMDTTCSPFAWAFLTVSSRDRRWSIAVRLALPPHHSVDSVPFWPEKFISLIVTIYSFTLHITLFRAISRWFERFVESFKDFELGTIADSKHFSGKYPCCHILLYRKRTESNPSGGRCSNISLWILCEPRAEFLVA